jgi:hypothetical protein
MNNIADRLAKSSPCYRTVTCNDVAPAGLIIQGHTRRKSSNMCLCALTVMSLNKFRVGAIRWIASEALWRDRKPVISASIRMASGKKCT